MPFSLRVSRNKAAAFCVDPVGNGGARDAHGSADRIAASNRICGRCRSFDCSPRSARQPFVARHLIRPLRLGVGERRFHAARRRTRTHSLHTIAERVWYRSHPCRRCGWGRSRQTPWSPPALSARKGRCSGWVDRRQRRRSRRNVELALERQQLSRFSATPCYDYVRGPRFRGVLSNARKFRHVIQGRRGRRDRQCGP
jgi:hypothetical protein